MTETEAKSYKDGQIDTLTDRYIDREIHLQIDTLTDRYTDREIH